MVFKRILGILLACTLIAGGLLIGLLVPEVALRIAGVEYKLYRIVDDDKGWIYRPGDAGWYRLEGESYVTINREGFLDRDHDEAKPKDVFRIALLGDSFVAAREVPPENEFATILEQTLDGCEALQGQAAEVVKFGIAGYGTDQELITLRQNVWKYDPDLVVLAFFTENDIANNTRYLNDHLYNVQKPGKPYFIFDERQELVIDDSFLSSEAYLAQKSWQHQVYQSLKSRLRLLQVMSRVKQTIVQRFFEPRIRALEDGQLMFADEIYKKPSDVHWQTGWQVTEELLRTMNREVDAKGADFLVVTLSNDLQVYPDPSVRQQAQNTLGIDNLFYPDRRIKSLGDRDGFDVLNLAPDFQVYAESHNVCLHGHDNAVPCGGHWSELGHRLAGLAIAQEVCNRLELIETDLSHETHSA